MKNGNFGITGVICSGKSHARMSLRALGFETLDADLLTYKMYDPYSLENHDLSTGDELYLALVKQFGKIILDRAGSVPKVNSERLREVCISDAKHMSEVSNILKMYLGRELDYLLSNKSLLFVEVPMLYEYNWQDKFGEVLVIAADYGLKLSRLMAKKRLSKEQAELWISYQLPQEEKIKRADVVIWNNEEIPLGKEFTSEDPLFAKMREYADFVNKLYK